MNVSSINSASDARRLLAAEMAADKTAGTDPAAKNAAALQSKKQASAVAKQFEAIILRQMLSPAIEPLMSEDTFGGKKAGGSGGGVYGYFVTDVLANSLSQGGGLGLSKILEKQLTPKGVVSAAQAAAAYNAGKVNKHE